ncbi:hypothetical protein L3X38_015356 [Prunus dulcis]|uniref:Uncharacterized protein n=1 Tax=Prunus dulcis TaxID=3755 RepID=A0AAD4WSI5_PRUDU|nr:hypothetical protein L3X38_015356 [Prunus dulcis]
MLSNSLHLLSTWLKDNRLNEEELYGLSAYISGEAFEAVEKEIGVLKGDKEKSKDGEEKEEIPAKVIAESIELARRQQEAQRIEPTSSELPLFDEVEAEHSAAVPEPEEMPEESAHLGEAFDKTLINSGTSKRSALVFHDIQGVATWLSRHL